MFFKHMWMCVVAQCARVPVTMKTGNTGSPAAELTDCCKAPTWALGTELRPSAKQ